MGITLQSYVSQGLKMNNRENIEIEYLPTMEPAFTIKSASSGRIQNLSSALRSDLAVTKRYIEDGKQKVSLEPCHEKNNSYLLMKRNARRIILFKKSTDAQIKAAQDFLNCIENGHNWANRSRLFTIVKGINKTLCLRYKKDY